MKKWMVVSLEVGLLFIAFIFIAYHYPIVHGDFSKVVIYNATDSNYKKEITNSAEITQLMNEINKSPRQFNSVWTKGFSYDHGVRGIMVFFSEDGSMKKFSIFAANGNILTKHWDIDTDIGVPQKPLF